MGNGEDTLIPNLNSWLLRRGWVDRNKAIEEVLKRQHPVPNGPKEMQGSQNLFLLELGCDAALNGALKPSLERELITRLERERDELGLWGSECTSPIYHHFTITGLSAIYSNTTNEHLRSLIVENLGSFFWYALRMGLAESKHGLIGMRGTGHDFAESGFPDLHFVCQYHTSGRPKDYTRLSSWKPMLKDSGWAFSGVAGGRNYELYKAAFELAVDNAWTPWRLRSKLTFVRIDGIDAGHFYERGINGNTPACIGFARRPIGSFAYLPKNLSIRVRQKKDDSIGGLSFSDGPFMKLTYDGIYSSLHGGSGEQQSIALSLIRKANVNGDPIRVEIMEIGLNGVVDWHQIYPIVNSQNHTIPPSPEPTNNQNAPKPPKPRKPWWKFW